MSQDQTRKLTTDEKLDLILARLSNIEMRMDQLEAGHHALHTEFAEFRAFAEPKLFDTKPIWEQALAEMMEVKQRVSGVEQRLEGVERELRKLNRTIPELSLESIEMRGRFRDLESRVDDLKSPRQ